MSKHMIQTGNDGNRYMNKTNHKRTPGSWQAFVDRFWSATVGVACV